jgi:glyoxalase/bleomycin resistance protein/dioxygenase superfamily protein
MTTPSLLPYYHVGIVVPDIAAAKAELSGQLGVRWGPILHLDSADYRDGTGADIVLPTTMCYSVDAPHLELMQEVPGSVWACNEFSNLHHIGFWSDDLGGDGAELAGSGCPMQMCGRAGADAPVSFAYHRSDLGVRIEIVDRAMRDVMGFLFQPDES